MAVGDEDDGWDPPPPEDEEASAIGDGEGLGCSSLIFFSSGKEYFYTHSGPVWM